MMYEIDNMILPSERSVAAGAPLVASVPPGPVFTEQAVAALRAYLVENKIDHYRIFHSTSNDIYDLEEYLDPLGEVAAWEALPAVSAAGEPLSVLTADENQARIWSSGCLRLHKHQLVFARWYWIDPEHGYRQISLFAAPSAEHYFRLRQLIPAMRRQRGAAVWQVVRGSPYSDPPATPRQAARDDGLMLAQSLRERVDADILRFFSAEVAELYKSMSIPHRRGVLLYGPPGNGKTSLIRHIGASLPQIPALILRPANGFDSDDLECVLDRWAKQAPALLVLEDLDWLLKEINTSTFLNQLDGIESRINGGLLLIASTNHPEKLDPAINNRPGRFDVVIEMANPDESLRRQFLVRYLSDRTAAFIRKLTADTAGFSFAHLQELVHLSGLFAIHAGRKVRSDQDIFLALESVQSSIEGAATDFAPKPEMPFGLAALRAHRQSLDR
jgi:hypothetical protein